jgi:hypothetical protein
MRPTLVLRAGVPGSVSANVVDIDGRSAVVVHIDPETKRGVVGGPTATPSPPRAALPPERLPRRLRASSGADVADGVAALLTGWVPRAEIVLLRRRAGHPRRERAGGPRSALLLGPADAVIDGRGLRARVRAPDGHGLHRGADHHHRHSVAPAPTPGPAGSPR